MVNVMKIKYTEATIKQLAKAKAQEPVKYAGFFEGKTYEEILAAIKKEEASISAPYKNYDRWGRLTIVGKVVRKYDLKRFKLPETATVKEFLEKKWTLHIKSLKKMIDKIDKNFDGSYSPPLQH